MSSADEISIHPSLMLIFPTENAGDSCANKVVENDVAWSFYSRSVRRNPENLSLHTHRVFIAMNDKNADVLPGSLHDLFYVLKDAGEKLRIRMLKASMPYLSKEDTLYFAMWIKTGIKNGIGYKWVNGSVLSDGLFGPDQELITMHKSADEGSKLSPLEESRACMEYGQLDVAKQILNDALEQDPDNSVLLEELAYLTNYSKSREIAPQKELTKRSFGRSIGKLKNKLFS